jgi:hypothetical protein
MHLLLLQYKQYLSRSLESLEMISNLSELNLGILSLKSRMLRAYQVSVGFIVDDRCIISLIYD